MRSELIIKSRSLAGSSDLTLLAPVRRGLVPSLESVTYKTRLKRVLATLNTGRTSSHEYALLRPFSDAVERVGKILSVRVAIVEPDRMMKTGGVDGIPDRVLLSVTFDGGFESYLRVLWQKVGTLLDVIFCNSEGYVTAGDHSYEEWAAWVRKVQIETDFFYGMPGHTVDDVQSLRKEEFLYRRQPGGNPTDLQATRQMVQSAEEVTWSNIEGPQVPIPIIKELGRQGLRALALIYRLAAYYLPGTPDGELLHRATRELLQEFLRLNQLHLLDPVIKEGKNRFEEQILWLLNESRQREIPALPGANQLPDDPADVQHGIISSYPQTITHGCLLLVAFPSRVAAAAFLDAMADIWVTRESAQPAPGMPFVNIAFTCEGLRAIGLSETQIGLFPQEFQEGMEARASVLGDLRSNHPRRWNLPLRNLDAPAIQGPLAIELSSVHAVVQLRLEKGPGSFGTGLDQDDPLSGLVAKLRQDHRDVDFLSVQPMARLQNDDGKPIEHFGFVDGKSQPVLDPAENGQIYNRNLVQLGEFLIGYDNEADQAEDTYGPPDPGHAQERKSLLHNGSFMVVRKLAQDVKALEDAVDPAVTGLDRELVLAKMMGRWRNGEALAALPGKGNDFDYSREDPPGGKCPFHAHIRRANPRSRDNLDLLPPPGRRTPRLMRRGMAYGPRYDPRDPASSSEPRGLVFMAYNASIAEQFEVVQRWISGGNSSGGFSGQSDPFLGVPQNAQRKFYRFEHVGEVRHIALDGIDAPLGDPQPFVRLQWGAYLFTPSITALRKFAQTARDQSNAPEMPPWSADDGRVHIDSLLALPQDNDEDREKAIAAWKAALEDPEAQRTFLSAGVWASIRRDHGGVLRTPYGVIVASRELIARVLGDRDGYSVCGYHERMEDSIGEIFLGLDDKGPGCPYRRQSDAVTAEMGKLRKDHTFVLARDTAASAIAKLIADEQRIAGDFHEPRWELNLDVREVVNQVLAKLCQQWFGLPTQTCEIRQGGSRWDWKPGDPPLYPGHFTAPSRYIFQPNPGDLVRQYGHDYGAALQQAFSALIKRHRDDPLKEPVLDASTRLTKIILAEFPRGGASGPAGDSLAARTMVGSLMGFLPTIDGNLKLSLNELLRDGSFWTLRGALKGSGAAGTFRGAEEIIEPRLKKAMQLRPSPELIWRTAAKEGRIGNVKVEKREKIVLAIVSATQHSLETDKPGASVDVYPVFGGNRGKEPHPTHACPAYEAAMGALLGVVSALMEVDESMRASVAPLALTLEGDVPAPAAPAWILIRRASGAGVRAGGVGAGRTIVTDGDSWVSYKDYFKLGWPEQNIARYLADQHDFKVVNIGSMGTRLHDFYDDNEATALSCNKPKADSYRLNRLLSTVANADDPKAILLSAAGNDVVNERLTRLLVKNNPSQPLDCALVGATVDGVMQCWLEKILDRINAACVSAPGVPIPVFLHGYDYPVPDCRWANGKAVPENAWLYPSFLAMEYESATWPAYPAVATPIMLTLIKCLNDMQARVAALPRFSGHVFHVKLTGTLSNQAADYQRDWANELHPTVPGFTAVTQVVANALVAKIPALQVQP